MITLYELYSNECYISKDGTRAYDNEILYPSNKIELEGVPNHIKSAFESALKVKGIDTAICLISLRRTLEAICRDKSAKGNNLDSMVKDLIDKNILPITFDDACWIIRQLGNKAAHADKTIFYKQQVDEVIGFLETIIEYLYSLPIKIQKLKNEIEEQNKQDMAQSCPLFPPQT